MGYLRRVLVFIRRDLLVAFGIVGMALNLIGGFGPLLFIARLAQYLVQHWVELTAFIWVKLFALLGLHIPPLFGFSLTIAAFHLGFVASSLKISSERVLDAPAAAYVDRDRLIALFLYGPIMWGTLMISFGALAANAGSVDDAAHGWIIILSFVLVVGSPILLFWLVPPSSLVRRLLTVYVVAGGILFLDVLARILDSTGLSKFISEKT